MSMNPPIITKTQASEISAPDDSKSKHALRIAAIPQIEKPQLTMPINVSGNLKMVPNNRPIRKVTITIKTELTAPLQPTSAMSLN